MTTVCIAATASDVLPSAKAIDFGALAVVRILTVLFLGISFIQRLRERYEGK